jgi:hypothetical protein
MNACAPLIWCAQNSSRSRLQRDMLDPCNLLPESNNTMEWAESSGAMFHVGNAVMRDEACDLRLGDLASTENDAHDFLIDALTGLKREGGLSIFCKPLCISFRAEAQNGDRSMTLLCKKTHMPWLALCRARRFQPRGRGRSAPSHSGRRNH